MSPSVVIVKPKTNIRLLGSTLRPLSVITARFVELQSTEIISKEVQLY